MKAMLFGNLKSGDKFILSKDSGVVLIKLPTLSYEKKSSKGKEEPFTAKFIGSGSPAIIPNDERVFKV